MKVKALNNLFFNPSRRDSKPFILEEERFLEFFHESVLEAIQEFDLPINSCDFIVGDLIEYDAKQILFQFKCWKPESETKDYIAFENTRFVVSEIIINEILVDLDFESVQQILLRMKVHLWQLLREIVFKYSTHFISPRDFCSYLTKQNIPITYGYHVIVKRDVI